MNRIESLSVRIPRGRIESIVYERMALSKQPNALIRQSERFYAAKGACSGS